MFNPLLLFTADFIGAAITSSLIVAAAGLVRRLVTVLIIGLMISYLTAAVTSILQYMSEMERFRAFVFWVLGSFAGVRWPYLTAMTFLVVVVF